MCTVVMVNSMYKINAKYTTGLSLSFIVISTLCHRRLAHVNSTDLEKVKKWFGQWY